MARRHLRTIRHSHHHHRVAMAMGPRRNRNPLQMQIEIQMQTSRESTERTPTISAGDRGIPDLRRFLPQPTQRTPGNPFEFNQRIITLQTPTLTTTVDHLWMETGIQLVIPITSGTAGWTIGSPAIVGNHCHQMIIRGARAYHGILLRRRHRNRKVPQDRQMDGNHTLDRPTIPTTTHRRGNAQW